ncbi:hypothetical protein [Sphingosinicella rhizophila]|uniref:Uncharacterized protein n=1 Tax=Sphingosinicella rhizophila TaxID=3050082 RepID=A0ABU3Q6E0_9SPHN|nr:hypothetical protein [Sphingosinicella sp. GR2756]MDT9598968.1 hypothetical protein [Sphingosinicella sp. GR2756]
MKPCRTGKTRIHHSAPSIEGTGSSPRMTCGRDADMGENEYREPQEWPQIVELYTMANLLLKELDELQMHQAAAYVSTAVEIMKRDHPDLGKSAD